MPSLALLSLAVIPVCDETSLKALTAAASPAASLDGALNVTLAAVDVLSPLIASANDVPAVIFISA